MSRIIRVIPRELLKHLEWTPGQEIPTPPQPPLFVPSHSGYSIDDLVQRGKPFYSTELDSARNNIGVAVSLQQAIEYATMDGVVANMPFLVAGKAASDTNNYLWKNWFTALSEEDIGIDKEGLFVGRGKPVIMVVHGGGILTKERIIRAYAAGLTGQKAAKLDEGSEFDNLLRGILPNGESIQVYGVEDVKSGRIADPFGRYAVAVDFETAKRVTSGYLGKTDFMENQLVWARIGTLDHSESYFDKAQHTTNHNVGNWHRFAEIDPAVAQGRVLFVDDDYCGLSGYDSLSHDGRFVGVAPEAHREK
jgi:hypothetical protein